MCFVKKSDKTIEKKSTEQSIAQAEVRLAVLKLQGFREKHKLITVCYFTWEIIFGFWFINTNSIYFLFVT